jgi:hypothetical protein
METLYVVLVVLSTALAATLLLAPWIIFIREVEAELPQALGNTPRVLRRQLGPRCYFALIFDSLRYYYTPAAVADLVAARLRCQDMHPPNA